MVSMSSLLPALLSAGGAEREDSGNELDVPLDITEITKTIKIKINHDMLSVSFRSKKSRRR